MHDAYRELGLKPGASQEEVRLAYRTLAKCWHPDRHAGRRTEAEALRRMQAINAAYDTLCRRFREPIAAPQPNSAPPPPSPYGETYAAVRALLAALLPAEAEAMLLRMGRRDAEGHYLLAICRFRRGDFGNALTAAKAAVALEPGYAEAISLARKLEALQPKPSLFRKLFRN